MRIKNEDKDSVTLELSAAEAGRIAADLTGHTQIAGDQALALARLLRDQGYFLEPAVSARTEWAGPDD